MGVGPGKGVCKGGAPVFVGRIGAGVMRLGGENVCLGVQGVRVGGRKGRPTDVPGVGLQSSHRGWWLYGAVADVLGWKVAFQAFPGMCVAVETQHPHTHQPLSTMGHTACVGPSGRGVCIVCMRQQDQLLYWWEGCMGMWDRASDLYLVCHSTTVDIVLLCTLCAHVTSQTNDLVNKL